MTKSVGGLWVAACLAFSICLPARATVIDFEDVTGPSTFAAAGAAVDYTITIGGYFIVVTGGHVLTNATNAPADETSIFGTASFASPGYVNPLTIKFFDAVTLAPKT